MAVSHRDICQLNRFLAITAERQPLQGPARSKYDWIDALQNRELTYTDFATPTVSEMTNHHARIQVTAKFQSATLSTTVFLQLTFIRDQTHWQLCRQQELSEKPIDWIRS
ncbi:hypothetical protein IV54_GL001786 [Levilactobacillus paucivorans]|uniref:DUF4440 domain-containing protein n=1 Tax=Levilactobacillus paucivorans TaxID=616990 RepID=A0A0R2M1E5_9LACO|nr:hypothetical protein IV54_GL001786 [Levilactobacillus paucivorans]